MNDKELLKWAKDYLKKYGYKATIPNDMTAQVNRICAEMREANAKGKEQYKMIASQGEIVTFNLKPLFAENLNPETLQTYICRNFIYSKGG